MIIERDFIGRPNSGRLILLYAIRDEYLLLPEDELPVDLKRLSIEFPEAYSACVTEEAKKYEYLTFKLNHENG